MLTIKWLRNKLKQDIKDVQVIKKEQDNALQEIARLNTLLKNQLDKQ